jgi:hypothetical protein
MAGPALSHWTIGPKSLESYFHAAFPLWVKPGLAYPLQGSSAARGQADESEPSPTELLVPGV